MAGLTQPLLLGGGNLAVQWVRGRWAFEYSHGFALQIGQFQQALKKSDRDVGLKLEVPWTTGGGLGYFLTDTLHFLIEFKVHRFNAALDGSHDSYTTFSIGPGLFYNLYLGNQFFIQPNFRFWPNIADSRSGQALPLTRSDASVYAHKCHSFDLFANMNLGWTF